MTPAERFLGQAAKCERMSRFSLNPSSKAVWRRMAERWRLCAKWEHPHTRVTERQRKRPKRAIEERLHSRIGGRPPRRLRLLSPVRSGRSRLQRFSSACGLLLSSASRQRLAAAEAAKALRPCEGWSVAPPASWPRHPPSADAWQQVRPRFAARRQDRATSP